MKLKLKSARQQIEENEAARDAQFLKDYPYGKYVIRKVSTYYKEPCTPWYIMQRQRSRGWLSSINTRGVYTSGTIPDEVHVSSRFACSNISSKGFQTLDACLTAARKRGFPEPLIQAFIEELNRRPAETKLPVQQGEKVNE